LADPLVPSDIAASVRDLALLAQQIPALPLTYQRVSAVVNDPHATAVQLSEAVGADQGLATKILQMANSAFYGQVSRVDTVTEAVALIGTRQLRDLALGMAVVDLFKDVSSPRITLRPFWEHSIAVGVGARLIAKVRGERETERNFVAGLLHDVGVMISAQLQPERLDRQVQRAHEDACLLSVAERADQGFDHAELGAVVLERWRLPQMMAEVVGGHHRPLLTATYARECADVHIADLVADALGFGSSGEPIVPPLDAHAWDLLGLPISELAGIADGLERQVIELTDIFVAR
jgi:putative nucleotidyltransferase with HDIG domain